MTARVHVHVRAGVRDSRGRISRARGLSRVRLVNRDRPVHIARPIKRDRSRGTGIESLSERVAMDFGAQHQRDVQRAVCSSFGARRARTDTVIDTDE